MGFWNNRAAGPGAREFDIEDMLERDWWKQEWRGTCLSREAPPDMIASVGSGYQRLIVIPSMDLIIVRLGQDAKFSDGDFLRILLGRRAATEPRSVHLDSIFAHASKAVVRRNTEEVRAVGTSRSSRNSSTSTSTVILPSQLLSRSRRCTKPTEPFVLRSPTSTRISIGRPSTENFDDVQNASWNAGNIPGSGGDRSTNPL